MDNTPRGRVRQALDLLKPYLVAFAEQALGASTPAAPVPAVAAEAAARDADATGDGPVGDAATTAAPAAATVPRSSIVGPAQAILAHWRPRFVAVLPAEVPLYLRDLVDVHRRWRGGRPFTDREARRVADTAWLVAETVGAPALVLAAFDQLAAGAVADASADVDAAAGGDAEPEVRRDGEGVIVNAAELTADDLTRQRVRCPACAAKDFAAWPSGWDAHAAHRCAGVAGATPAARKAEYRRRFAPLFRDAAARG